MEQILLHELGHWGGMSEEEAPEIDEFALQECRDCESTAEEANPKIRGMVDLASSVNLELQSRHQVVP